ncbi:IpaD/SipD/SspD family type III secretion system needle tip protein [Pseudomonas migulae]|uniref:Type III secretion system translocon protein, IpaD/SipD family n=1 Tax=Pseudomonas migulae TaxID=78543 RepID=A0A1H5I445_9PSED|nr:IpaD/SipD/SspD family type III secretion system needle tip protein [Pseudomonas migulae]SEE34671.1 type III secretion system translocon protein, IpaD/SipD family [Pseudomonas migulae]
MIITQSSPSMVKPAADFNVDTDASVPAEIPLDVHAVSALAQLLDRSISALNRNCALMLKCQPASSRLAEGLIVDSSAQNLIAEFVEQLEAKRNRSQLWAQKFKQCSAVMTHSMETLPMEQRQRLYDEQGRMLCSLKEMHIPPDFVDEFDVGVKSSNDFFDKLLELINLIKNGYLAGYEHIIAAYSDFFADFNKEITAKMKEWIEGANEGKEVKLNAGAIRLALQALINKYSPPNAAAVLFPAPGMGKATKAEAEKWLKALGLPDSCLHRNNDGSYSVVMDLGPLKIMKDGLPSSGGWVTWDTAGFQAWQTGFNAQEERMKNMLQSFTQKYSNANSYHDNFNKTLSAHLSQYADMLKAMLNF